jgi:transposase
MGIKLKDEMTVKDLMEIFKVSRTTIGKWVKKFELKGEKRNIKGYSLWIFTREQVESYLKEKNA